LNKTITLFEHQSISYEELGFYPDHPVIDALDQLNNLFGKTYIQLGLRSLKATAYVGIIRIGEITFQILPKIDYDPKGDPDQPIESDSNIRAVESASRNLLFLLSYALNIQLHQQEISSLLTRRAGWLELLTFLFASGLHRELQAGINHDYVPVEEPLPVIKGRWDIQRQLTISPFTRHIFQLRYDQYSLDIPINRVFRYVSYNLLPQTFNSSTRTLLSDIFLWLDPAERMNSISTEYLDQVSFSRLNNRFLPYFNLARLFIENQIVELLSGGRKVFAFLFDMNILFERFVFQLLNQNKSAILPLDFMNLDVQSQAQGTTTYLVESVSLNRNIIRLRPDIQFIHPLNEYPRLILDTKYKILSDNDLRLRIAESDLYQMLAYTVRFGCPLVLLIYPQGPNQIPIRSHFRFIDYPADLFVSTINIRQSLHEPGRLIDEFYTIFNQQIIW
jgi:5-methylcytosine-specific restriction enzyme subunit McrC